MKSAIKEILTHIDPEKIKFNQVTVTDSGGKKSHDEFIRGVMKKLSRESRLELIDYEAIEIIDELRLQIAADSYVHVDQGTPISSTHFSPLIPVQDIYTSERRLITPEGHLTEIDYSGWFELLDKNTKALVNRAIVVATTVYDPHEKCGEEEIHGRMVRQMNSYKRPKWMGLLPLLSHERKVVEELPEEIQKFFDHLFIDQESLDYVLDWMYHLITARNEVALVVNGAKGVGKGLLGSILQGLVGVTNHKKARVNMLDTNFNSDFRHTRLMEFDELKITRDRVNHLKLYFNDEFAIEAKGIDGGIRVKNHGSFYISANGAGDLYLESDDRRFSVIKVTDAPLLGIMSEGEINDLVTRITMSDGDLIKQVGEFVLTRRTKLNYGTVTAFKTERFYELVENSLSGWQKYVFKHINEKKNDVSIEILRKKYNRQVRKYPFPENDTPIVDFLRSYRDVSGERIADGVDGMISVNNSEGELL